MFATLHVLLVLFYSISAIAQSTQVTLCIPGQCLQGLSNTSVGSTLTASDATTIQLLPGQYSASTGPQTLHDTLTSSSAALSSSPGFTNSTVVLLPLDLSLEAGLAIFSDALYSGQSSFLPTLIIGSMSMPLTAQSLTLSSAVWITLKTGKNDRIIVWDSIPDVKQLPHASNLDPLSIIGIQSSTCNPECASSGGCTDAGTCQCTFGFTGALCQSCPSGFFGPQCKPCPTNCKTCDDGTAGSGRCLQPKVANDPANCNCLNGECGPNGKCICNAGFTTANNGTACAACSPGFFLTSTGDCKICQLGCVHCADGTGNCITCNSGFSQDVGDPTKCDLLPTTTATGQNCSTNDFSDGISCLPCSSQCQTCTGGTPNDCIGCATGFFNFNGTCVSANSDGVCEGSGFIADNAKRECDACGAKCTACKIPNFNITSTVDQKQCTACLPGSFLFNGTCVGSCPSGTTVSSKDNVTCIACDPSCETCAGTSTFCLTCADDQLASGGNCVSNCPSNTFSSAGSCRTCHPDCASCSGSSFNQCTSCPPNRPVLTSGRCLPTCKKSQFFDSGSSICRSCDSSCSSCSDGGPNNCLGCSSLNHVLAAGSCVAANCISTSNVIAGLGVCLSDLVVPQPSATTVLSLPSTTVSSVTSVTGLNSPVAAITKSSSRIIWWQVLLMALGCAFILVLVIWLFRRRQRNQRSKGTAQFAMNHFGQAERPWNFLRLFYHPRNKQSPIVDWSPPRSSEEGNEEIKNRRAFDEIYPRQWESRYHHHNNLAWTPSAD